MQPRTPTSIVVQDQYNKDLSRSLAGNLSPGNGATFDSDGYPLTFTQDNMSGCLIRIGSSLNPNALPDSWAAVSTDLTIEHNLGKVPYGVIVIFKLAPTDVWFGTIPPTSNTVTLQTSNIATDTTVWLLA